MPKAKKKVTAKNVKAEQRRVVQIIRRLTIEQVAELASMVITSDSIELERISKDRATSSVLQRWYARVAMIGIQDGDVYALNAVLDRVIGKVTQNISVTGEGGGPLTALLTMMSSEERMEEIERLRRLRETAGND